ncbi:hypothetical protein ACFLQR_00465 [Verrucomicrobiota bacterium]
MKSQADKPRLTYEHSNKDGWGGHRILHRVFLCFLMALATLSSNALIAGAPTIQDACIDRNARFDTGTIHILVLNDRSEEYELDSVSLTNVLWYRSIPSVIAPYVTGEILIRLRQPVNKDINVTLLDTKGNELKVVARPRELNASIKSVFFDEDLREVYIYVGSKQELPLPESLLAGVGKNEVSHFNVIRSNDAKSMCIKAVFSRKLTQCEPVWIKIVLPDVGTLQAVVKAIGLFPISSWDGDTRQELSFDPAPFRKLYKPENDTDLRLNREKGPMPKAYEVLEDPSCKDCRKLYQIGGHGKQIVERIRTIESLDPLHPTFIHICEWKKKYGYFAYAGITDIIFVNPYEIAFYPNKSGYDYYSGNPEMNGYFACLAKTANQPRLLFTIPAAFNDKDKRTARFPTPEELRLTVYSQLIAGSRGILYFTKGSKSGRGYEGNRRLKKEIGRLNKELRSLRPLLRIADTFSVACSVNRPKIRYHALLAGDLGILIIVINQDYKNSFSGLGRSFRYQPKSGVGLEIEKLHDLPLTDSIYVMGAKGVAETTNAESIGLRLERLDITACILIPTPQGQELLKANPHNLFIELKK